MPPVVRTETRFAWGRYPELWLLTISAALAGVHVWWLPPNSRELLPAAVYSYALQMSFESPDEDVQIRTYLPVSDERQFVMDEAAVASGLVFSESDGNSGRVGRWVAGTSESSRQITYRARLALQGVKFEIPADLLLPLKVPPGFADELKETAAVQVSSPEIETLWNEIRPAESTVLATLRAIHDYTTHHIEGAEFKGYTDALTALRLQQASCNGKSRLFVALTRLNKLPARLVGGVILNSGSKKTSHQWVEVNIGGQWVPFDPTNDHFAEIPDNYLVLYRGDEALFTHTRNINFDYLFAIGSMRTIGFETLSPVSGGEPSSWLPKLLHDLGFEASLLGTLLLFPFAALLISIGRNIIGLSTFGVFMPMLVGAACRYTGLGLGLVAVGVVVGVASMLQRPLKNLNLLQVPRVSAMVTIVTLLIVTTVVLTFGQIGTEVSMLTLFPVIILSFTAEKIATAIGENSRTELFKSLAFTVVMIVLCYVVFSSMLLQGVVLAFPETLLAVLGLQIAVGRWTGIRVFEFIRFRRLLNAIKNDLAGTSGSGRLLGMNSRNRDLIQQLNPPELIATANDKVLTKRLLVGAGVQVPRTLAVVQDVWDLQSIRQQLPHWFTFVVKPARSGQGRGILVIRGRDGEHFLDPAGTRLDRDQIIAHMRRIVAGEFSMSGDRDEALIEHLIHPSAFYQQLSGQGLCDVRIILVGGEVLAAMLRVPTSESGGKANLHSGGVGVPINVATGETGAGYRRGIRLESHPDTGVTFAGRCLPNWTLLLDFARRAQKAIPLGLIGVDIAEDAGDGPVVLEVNARPGLEIQNVNGMGFADLAQRLVAATTSAPADPEPAR